MDSIKSKPAAPIPNLARRAAAAFDALEQRRAQRLAAATPARLTDEELAQLSNPGGRSKSAKTFDTPLSRRFYGLPPDRNTLSCAEVAEIFRVSATHIQRLCDAGLIVAKGISGRPVRSVNYWSIPLPAIMAFLRKRQVFGGRRAKPKKTACKRAAKAKAGAGARPS